MKEKTTHVKCGSCGSQSNSLVTQEDEWKIVKCRVCGFVYVNPQPCEEFLKRHYQGYLPQTQIGIDAWGNMMSWVFDVSWRMLKKFCGSQRPVRSLDIGCGHGFFLQKAKREGWCASGIDLSEQAVRYAISKGLDASNSTLFEKKYKDGEFDVVTMFYVLEHVPDPASYLQEVYRILKPQGVLLLRVPDTTPIVKILKVFKIPNKLYDAPSHLSDFSSHTIKKMLIKTGFSEVRTVIGGMTFPAKIGECFISCVCGGVALLLEAITFGKYLLPGVSKTTIARKL